MAKGAFRILEAIVEAVCHLLDIAFREERSALRERVAVLEEKVEQLEDRTGKLEEQLDKLGGKSKS